MNKSCSNDKLFLKNIVKKAKKVDARVEQANKRITADCRKNTFENRNGRVISSIESEVCESIT